MSNKAIELAKSLVSEWHEDQINFDTALSAAAELRALHAEVEGLRKDAARYRWLSNQMYYDNISVGEAIISFNVYGACPHKTEVDSAIDKHMETSIFDIQK